MAYEQEQTQLEEGAQSWKDRLLEQLTLVSPSGTSYLAKWRGDPRRVEKRVGIFDFPGVNGSLVQDHGAAGMRYPLTFWFDGKDHDLIAANFQISILEKGVWSVEHPVHGYVELQPISIEEDVNPVESGNITKFVTEWIEPLDEETLQTARELYGIVDELIAELNATAAQAFVEDAETDTYSKEAAVANTAERQATQAAEALEDLANGDARIADATSTAQAGVASTVAVVPLDTEALAGFLQGALQKPALGSDDIDERTAAYNDLTDTLADSLPSSIATSAEEKRNAAVTTELNMLSTLAGSAIAVTTGTPKTREQAVDKATELIDQFQTVTDYLDAVQELFEDKAIDEQYFSMTDTHTVAGSMVTAAVKYLLTSSYDLAVEKKFTLKAPSCPVRIAIEEYGTLGENDANVDRVIDANGFKGNDILWLDSGREVVVYV